LRVPTPTVSVLDLIVEVEKPTSAEEVIDVFQKAGEEKRFQGILRTEKELLVSSDFIADTFSAIVDSASTMVKDNLIKILGWYDNEWGYSCRLAEFAEFVGKRL